MVGRSLRVAFIHPDLGIGGAERLVVDAALGLQKLGHSVDIYTSHHDRSHCFDETKDGSLKIHHIRPPFPRSVRGKFHILLAHARQLHLISHLLHPFSPNYDVYFVDQLSTCIPLLRLIGKTRVVFYCHFPDKLLANGEFIDGNMKKKNNRILKAVYRFPMDWLEETTTKQADVILANSKFTARVFKSHFPSISVFPQVVYPGINISAYRSLVDPSDPDIIQITSDRPTLLSLNRFEKKKNAALAISSFALLRVKFAEREDLKGCRLVIAGGYDPRLADNIQTLVSLIDTARSCSLSFDVIAPSSSSTKVPPFNCDPSNPDILFLLNFTTGQRSALLRSPSTIALLYTPANEHFGIGPVEGMICGLPILACDTGGPTESIVDSPADQRTGWLRPPDSQVWYEALTEIVNLPKEERIALEGRSKKRAEELFGMQAMAKGLEQALQEATAQGPVTISSLWLIILGFIIAYLAGPILLPSS